MTPPDVVERARRYVAAVPRGRRRPARRRADVPRLLPTGAWLRLGTGRRAAAARRVECPVRSAVVRAELLAKLEHAHRYGREPIGGLLGGGA